MLTLMMCALTGTLFIYQGQEIGMINMPRDWPIEELKDFESLSFFESVARDANNDEEQLDRAMHSIRLMRRDNARLPMQWDDSPFAGFTDREAGGWMRTHDLYAEMNAAKQQREPDSVLSFWKHMIALRKAERGLFIHGSFELFEPDNEETFVFAKRHEGQRALVALNFTKQERTVCLPEDGWTFRVGNYPDAGPVERTEVSGERKLRPWEGQLYMAS